LFHRYYAAEAKVAEKGDKDKQPPPAHVAGIVDQIAKLNILEVSDLVKALQVNPLLFLLLFTCWSVVLFILSSVVNTIPPMRRWLLLMYLTCVEPHSLCALFLNVSSLLAIPALHFPY
jgi:hypothetical protein